jgi:hypothetical protein
MKNIIILVICFIIHSFVYAQIITDIDDFSPFYEDLSAIKKGDQWAFINNKGIKVIDFRDDLVSSKTKEVSIGYPIFEDGRCLIRKLNSGTYYYGYIDKNGKQIIAPQYLNATNFKNGYAIVITLEKEVIGFNESLGKDVVSYTLKEYIIDTSGKTVKILDNARNYVKSKYKYKNIPSFYSKFVGNHLIAVQTTDAQKYNIYKF